MDDNHNSARSNERTMPLVAAVLAHRRPQDDDPKWRLLEALAETMELLGHERDDPVRTVFGFIGDRWSSLVLITLDAGPWRYGELRRVVSSLAAEEQITQRMLTLTLRALEREGLVSHELIQEKRVSSIYRITDPGRELVSLARQIIEWVGVRFDYITVAAPSRARHLT